jgi:hypothetical protein
VSDDDRKQEVLEELAQRLATVKDEVSTTKLLVCLVAVLLVLSLALSVLGLIGSGLAGIGAVHRVFHAPSVDYERLDEQLEQGKYVEVEAEIARHLETRPRDEYALLRMVRTKYLLKKYAECVRFHEQLLEVRPDWERYVDSDMLEYARRHAEDEP